MVTYIERVARGDKDEPKLEKVEPKPKKVVMLESLVVRPTRATDDIKPRFGRVYGGSSYTMNKGGLYGDRRKKRTPTRKD
jgi:hypothetical protein